MPRSLPFRATPNAKPVSWGASAGATASRSFETLIAESPTGALTWIKPTDRGRPAQRSSIGEMAEILGPSQGGGMPYLVVLEIAIERRADRAKVHPGGAILSRIRTFIAAAARPLNITAGPVGPAHAI